MFDLQCTIWTLKDAILTNHSHNEKKVADNAHGQVDAIDDLANHLVMRSFPEEILNCRRHACQKTCQTCCPI